MAGWRLEPVCCNISSLCYCCTESASSFNLIKKEPTRIDCIAQGALLNVLWPPEWEGSVGAEWIHVYVWLRTFAVYLKLSQHCSLVILRYKIKSKKKKKHSESFFFDHCFQFECLHFTNNGKSWRGSSGKD